MGMDGLDLEKNCRVFPSVLIPMETVKRYRDGRQGHLGWRDGGVLVARARVAGDDRGGIAGRPRGAAGAHGGGVVGGVGVVLAGVGVAHVAAVRGVVILGVPGMLSRGRRWTKG